jgi:UDP-glucose 4-epimerase
MSKHILVTVGALKFLGAVITPRRQGDVSALVVDNAKILKTLPWRPEHDRPHEILNSTLVWEKIRENNLAI